MMTFVGIRSKTYSYLIDEGSEDEKPKGANKCDLKRKLKFHDYRNCLESTQLESKVNYLEKNRTDIDSYKY